MTARRRRTGAQGAPDGEIFTTVDDETYDDLTRLVGQRIVHIAVWEDSVADALAAGEESESAAGAALADVDVYLRDGAFFELFGVAAFEGPEEQPVPTVEAFAAGLAARVEAGLWLVDVAVDEEDALVLVLGEKQTPALYLVVGAWTLGEWEELPEVP